MDSGEEIGCAVMTVVLLIISFAAGASVCHIKWRDWNVQRAVESGEAHYDTKTGKLVWDKNHNLNNGISRTEAEAKAEGCD